MVQRADERPAKASGPFAARMARKLSATKSRASFQLTGSRGPPFSRRTRGLVSLSGWLRNAWPNRPFDAKIPVIGQQIRVGCYLHESIALYFKLELAAGAAIGTGGPHLFNDFIDHGHDLLFLVECTGGAVINALAAGNTFLVEPQGNGLGPALFIKARGRKLQGFIFAGIQTALAEYALVQINGYCRMGCVLFIERLFAHAGLVEINIIVNGKSLQVAAVKGGTAAGKTAFSLLPGYFLVKAELDLVKIPDRTLRFTLQAFFPGVWN